jgi:UDP-N-acetylglucosamine 3-dehydrogenase
MTRTTIGLLSVAHHHADSYVTCLDGLDRATLVGVTATGDERDDATAKAEEYGTEVYAPDDLLDRVDGAVVCATNADHRYWVERAADASVDVLCEKPLAPSVDDARAIVDTCADADVHCGVAMPLRFSQPVRNAKAALDNNAIGDVRFLSGTNRGQMPGEWFTDPEQAGGGAIMDHTVHIVDVVRWLTGCEVQEVYAEIDTRFHDIPVEDCNLLSMELTDGTQFVLDGSWSKPDQWDTWGDATLRIVGREGVISIDCFDQSTKHTRDTEVAGINSLYWGSNPDEGLINDFVESVAEDRPPLTTGSDGVEAVAVVDAAYRSAKQGTPVIVRR